MYLYTYCKFIYMYICICHIFTCLCISMYHQIRVCYIHIHICTHFLCCAGLSKRPVRKRSARCGPLGEWLRRPSQSSFKRTFRRRSLPEFRFVHVARAHPCLFLASFSISIVAYADACSCPMWWLMDWSNLFYTIGKGKLEIQEYGGAGFTGSYSVCNRDGVVVEDDLGNTTKICQVRDFCWAWGAAHVLSLMTYSIPLATHQCSISFLQWELKLEALIMSVELSRPNKYILSFSTFQCLTHGNKKQVILGNAGFNYRSGGLVTFVPDDGTVVTAAPAEIHFTINRRLTVYPSHQVR